MKDSTEGTGSNVGRPVMGANLTRIQTPEELELKIKEAELATLQMELSERELELATFEAEFRTFEVLYLRVVGSRYAALDELEARIAERRAEGTPQDETARERAASARQQADESARRTRVAADSEQKTKFKPSEDLKKLFRDLAKQIHPDLTLDEQERKRRHHLMAEANLAFEAGDALRLDQILREWKSSPESIKGEGIAAELVRVIRKISQVRERLRLIEARLDELRKSDLYQLKMRVEEAEAAGRDLLAEMASSLDRRIAAAQIELNAISKEGKR